LQLKKDRKTKKCKKDRKIALFPLPPAADAHDCNVALGKCP